MIVKKEVHKEEDGSDGWIECVYSYANVDNDLYKQLEESESQGKFFQQNIRNNFKHPHAKEYKLFDHEINDAKKLVEEWKNNQQ